MSAQQRVRVRFRKVDDARFMSHLSLRKAWERALRRAGIPASMTQGFNPHLKFALGAALPVGVGSQGDYADFYVERPLDMLEFTRRLSGALPPGLEIVEAREVPMAEPSLETQVGGASYRVLAKCDESLTRQEVEAAIGDILELKEIPLERRGKKKRLQDVRPMIHALKVLDVSDGDLAMSMLLSAGPRGSLRPQEVIGLMASTLQGRIDQGYVEVTRENLLIDSGGSWQTP